jgi:hypothetical protein
VGFRMAGISGQYHATPAGRQENAWRGVAFLPVGEIIIHSINSRHPKP